MENERDAVTREAVVAKSKFIQKAVKHPGRVTRAAKRDGLTVPEEAKKMSKSPDKSRASAGRLALRFEGKAKHGNFRKPKTRKRAGKRA